MMLTSRNSFLVRLLVATLCLLLSVRISQAQQRNFCRTDTQCLNNGQCVETDHNGTTEMHYHCECQKTFGGSRCENFCPLECLNGGYCRYHDENIINIHQQHDTDAADYACKCLGYFTGTLCEIPYENCSDGSKCLNGGQCTGEAKGGKKKTTATCDCPEGYTAGSSCQIDGSLIDETPSPSTSSSKGSVLTEIFVPLTTIAFVAALVLYHRRRRYTVLEPTPPPGSEFVPHRQGNGNDKEWMNVI